MKLLILLALFTVACGSPSSKGPTKSSNNTATNNTTASNNTTQSSNNGTNSSNNATTPTNNATCDGCVSDGECLSGESPDACGAAGDACFACSDGWVCFDGECLAPPTCDANNCGGCCDEVRGCVESVDVSACGAGGQACSTCDGNETCTDGACVKPCAESCPGCCDGEVCLAGTADTACGAAGDSCESCGDASSCSDQRVCVADTCADSCAGCCDGSTCLNGSANGACGASGDSCVSCGTGRTCSGQTCIVDPVTRWELVLVSGSMSTLNDMGEAWDFIGTIDPVVDFELVDAQTTTAYRATSSIIQDDATPTWNESVLTDVPAPAFRNWKIDVYDSDLDPDDYVCGINVQVTDDAVFQDLFSGATYTFSCTGAGGVFADINVRLQ